MDDVIYRQDVLNLIPQDISDFEEGSCLAYDVGRLPSAQQWIPCSERLPDVGVNVLTQGVNGNMITNRIIDGKRGWWFWNDEYVAWMPLPSPYKGENE